MTIVEIYSKQIKICNQQSISANKNLQGYLA